MNVGRARARVSLSQVLQGAFLGEGGPGFAGIGRLLLEQVQRELPDGDIVHS